MMMILPEACQTRSFKSWIEILEVIQMVRSHGVVQGQATSSCHLTGKNLCVCDQCGKSFGLISVFHKLEL